MKIKAHVCYVKEFEVESEALYKLYEIFKENPVATNIDDEVFDEAIEDVEETTALSCWEGLDDETPRILAIVAEDGTTLLEF